MSEFNHINSDQSTRYSVLLLDWPLSHPIISAGIHDVEEIASLNELFRLDILQFLWNKPDWIAMQIRVGNYFVIRDEEGIAAALCLHLDTKKTWPTLRQLRSERICKGSESAEN